jgi:hypothetical protein
MTKRAIMPPPDMGESLVIDLVGLQEIDHEFLKATSLVTFGSCFGTVFRDYFIKIHNSNKFKGAIQA